MRKALVTGSGGFIGKNLVKYLKGLNHEVIEYDIVSGFDITDYNQLRSVFKDHSIAEGDHVYHLAAQAYVAPGEADPYKDLQINGVGMINMLRCVEEFKPRLVFSSSGAVYGLTNSFPHAEDAVLRPTANYGCTKRLAELYLQKWAMMHGVVGRIVRFSSVYGPGRGPNGPVNAFLAKAEKGEPLTVYGDGSQTRDLIYVYDACAGMHTVMHRGVAGEIYNIGLGVEHSVLDVARLVSSLTGAPIEFVLSHRFSKFDVQRSYYNIGKVSRLGYSPIYSLEDGVSTTYTLERGKATLMDVGNIVEVPVGE